MQFTEDLLQMEANVRKDVQPHDDKENESLQSMRYCFPCNTDRTLKLIFLSFGEGARMWL